MFFDVVTREIQAAPEELIIGAKSDKSVNYFEVRWPLYVPRQVNAATGTSIVGYFKLSNGDVVSSKYSTSYVNNDYRYVSMLVPKRATKYPGPVLFRLEVIGQSGTISSLELELTVVDSLCSTALEGPLELKGATGSFALKGGKIHSALPFRSRIGGDRSNPELSDFKWLSTDEIQNIKTIPPGIAITSPYRGLANFIADPYMFSHNKQDKGDWYITSPWKIQNDGVKREEIGANAVPPFASRIDVEAVHGLSEQKQYKGYQLLNLSTIVQTSWKVEGDLVTQIIDSTNASNFAGSIPEEHFGDKITIHCDPTSTANVRVRITHAGGTSYIQSNNAGRLRTIDLSIYDGVTEVRIGVYGTAKASFVKKPMVEYGSVAHEWEPYVGEIPSPNPAYLQEIVSAVNPKVTVTGKNLANFSEVGTIGTDGAELGDATFARTPFIPIQDSEYALSTKEALTSNARVFWYDEHKVFLGFNQIDGSQTLVRRYSEAAFVRLRAKQEQLAKGIQFERGSIATAYEPYHVEVIILPVTLRSIGDIHDDVRLNEYGQAEVVRAVGTHIFTADDSWNLLSDGHRAYSTALQTLPNPVYNIPSPMTPLPNLRIDNMVGTGTGIDNVIRMYTNWNGNTIIARTGLLSEYTTPAAISALVNGHEVLYQQAEPTIEPHSELTELLKSLRDISSDHTVVVTDEAGRDVPWLSFYKSGIKEIYASRTGATTSLIGLTAMPHNYLYQNDIEVAVDGITVSFDLKIDNPQTLDDGRICILRTYDSYGIMLGTMDAADLLTGNKYDTDISQFVAGEWKRVSLTFTQADLKTGIPSGWNKYYAAISFELPKNGGIHIRKPSVDRGEEWVMDVDLTDYPEGSEVPVTILGYYVNTN